MSKNRVWGTHIEVEAAARVYEICVHVYTKTDKSYRTGLEGNKSIALIYRGDGQFGHFNVVEDIHVPQSSVEKCTSRKRSRDKYSAKSNKEATVPKTYTRRRKRPKVDG